LGKAEPLHVHRVLGAYGKRRERTQAYTFVGREGAELEAYLDRGFGDSQCLIEAEAGAGKSRLIAEGFPIEG
jgi:hypothetical protein